jgi:hypothetical protein
MPLKKNKSPCFDDESFLFFLLLSIDTQSNNIQILKG